MVEELVFNVGRKLKQVRGELGLSLRQLSEKTAVSPSTIQKIESNQISPTLATILKIAKGLGKDIQFFLDQGHNRTEVAFCGKNHRRLLSPSNLSFNIELLSEGLSDPQFTLFILNIPPGGKRGSHVRHQGEVFQYCLAGEIEFTIRGKKYLLKMGDTLHFKTDLRHSWLNVGRGVARLLMVSSPPVFIGRNSHEI